MRVETHLHIRRFLSKERDCLSVRDLPDGKVWYTDALVLTDCTFAVQPAGLRRFRELNQKNVHAFVRGTFVAHFRDSHYPPVGDWSEAYYNPMLVDSFVDKESREPITSAKSVILRGNKVYYR
jgi:hypothetical protein